MKPSTVFRHLVAAVALYALLAGSAYAQATRTWVSGVGDDANPCSRTAPCKTFAGAISKTAASGTISVLDPGGFGAVTITKSITIETDGQLAGVVSAGTNGVVVNAGVNDVVTLRGLQMNGVLTGVNGIRFLAGGRLIVEDCAIQGVANNGIDLSPTTASRVLVRNTTISRVAGGSAISVTPGVGGSVALVMENTRLFSNKNGLTVVSGTATVNDSVVSGSDQNGIFANSAGANVLINVSNSRVTNNTAVGIRALNATSSIFVSNTIISGNGTGVAAASSASISTYKNNSLVGNTTAGAFTATVTGD
ncbi:MAG TPA: right-handed parallel beta-helix repeat-containing protein [Tahibacter sp.]|uniref:right-handed parallel beta-helix repeat-containing protein n=1 Tax=Tahibacter sp. TaxID=2056211 RepID=UPI002C9B83E2|nr:right-handed parallel beta-helix repeat-containing protein [Tahibacter sp.]HSX62911.1 right-handed parallel beta-helix repeat-containing protein [Tahibacter sp.]